MMPISRSCFSSFRHRSKEAFNLLRRSAQSNRVQSQNYANSSKRASGRTDISTSTPVDTPPPRSRGSFVIPVAATILGFAGLVAFLSYNDERRVVKKGQDNCSCANNLKGPKIGGPFTLKDTGNHTVTEKNLQGNWAVLYFGYTSSPDVGPEQVQMMAKAINILESRHNLKVLPVFVTIDPERDNTSHLCAYLKEFDSRILGLTGSVTAIRQMAQECRVFFRKIEEDGDDYLVESSHNMYLMSPNMEVVRCFGVEYNAEELSEAILKELKLREPQLKG
ncbi:protein SCO1 homolog 2, mitochondrial [Argentina anserina]|uniref:protein SCO1 homolog 2, mitochondrial n=1 Tax=Argentina anserina TaxID=57926 RepID=UPI00217677A1|nr:protein SCO1 homolog 2, mitochondrial [Potentilla anserina]XP_050374019.1 protein SCO1 homolog 2, mitochondrial [Potentilla anserina]